jgi:hypothetical protein
VKEGTALTLDEPPRTPPAAMPTPKEALTFLSTVGPHWGALALCQTAWTVILRHLDRAALVIPVAHCNNLC